MKWRLLVLVTFFSLCGHAAEWQQELTPPNPGPFQNVRPYQARYRFGWSAFTAANADLDLNRTDNGLLRLGLKTKTIGFVRTLWQLDAQHTSLIRPATFAPVSVYQAETYKDESQTTRVAFTGEGVTRMRSHVPAEPGDKKVKRFEAPNVFDLHGALQFVRSLPLRQGDVYKLVVHPSSSPYLAQLNVVGRERVEATGRKYDAVKVDVKLWRIDDDDMKLKSHSKFKRATAWMSDDSDRLLVKITSEISVGSVWAELDRVEFH